MQRIYPCELTVEDYVKTEAHRQVRPEEVCPRCGRTEGMHRHGVYERGITGRAGRIGKILIARFLCLACRGTVSYLPEFALSYRLVAAATVEAFLEGKLSDPAVQRWQGLLAAYQRRLRRAAALVWRTIGCGFGRAPPRGDGLWPWWKQACGGLASAARRLVAQFRITLFRRYHCHQPRAVG